jgi:hypothetical protein
MACHIVQLAEPTKYHETISCHFLLETPLAENQKFVLLNLCISYSFYFNKNCKQKPNSYLIARFGLHKLKLLLNA